MQPNTYFGMAREVLDKRQVGTLERLLIYTVEITNWLMRMDQENEMELGQGHAPERQSTVSYRPEFSDEAWITARNRLMGTR